MDDSKEIIEASLTLNQDVHVGIPGSCECTTSDFAEVVRQLGGVMMKRIEEDPIDQIAEEPAQRMTRATGRVRPAGNQVPPHVCKLEEDARRRQDRGMKGLCQAVVS